MHNRLISYLQDNRDQVIEYWLTEVEVPAPANSMSTDDGVIPYAFLAEAFDAVLKTIKTGSAQLDQGDRLHLDNFLGITCECKERHFGGRVCMELHDAGLRAFMSIFESNWDTEHEFNTLDRECCKDLINQALSGFFGQEIERCPHRDSRNDCPFVTQQLPKL
jgi:hypothetical protein